MVWHKNLLAKMTSVGLAPKLCKLFESFLSARGIKVVVDGISSSSFHTNAGVPQGSVIPPTLFLIYINDLLYLPSNPVHCYAYDSTLHNAPASHKDRIDIASSINLDLCRLKDWRSENLVKLQCSVALFLGASIKTSPTYHSILTHWNSMIKFQCWASL